MNQYVTGAIIKRLREEKRLTQQQLAEKLSVTDKSVSKWETGRGYPDISLLKPLCDALGVSLIELMSGEDVVNTNRSFNILKTKFYVCPICGNVIFASGESVVSCHGVSLPPLEAEETDDDHSLVIEKVEDEYYVTASHPMTKDHYISFVAAVKDNGVDFIKLYPEGNTEARFKTSMVRYIYYYCNKHGLFRKKL
ncbi:MAG: helix-turn-helix domain-containing protein [Clostridia bacterium]|nr:helix-turn-helix domain-containing protein [Clostridia bacterium]